VVDNEEVKQGDKQVELQMSKHQQLVFNILMTSPTITAIGVTDETKNKLVESLMSADNFPIDEDKLHVIFVKDNRSGVKVTKQHVIDFALMFQFLYNGTFQA